MHWMITKTVHTFPPKLLAQSETLYQEIEYSQKPELNLWVNLVTADMVVVSLMVLKALFVDQKLVTGLVIIYNIFVSRRILALCN